MKTDYSAQADHPLRSAEEGLVRVRSFLLNPRPSVLSEGPHGTIIGSSAAGCTPATICDAVAAAVAAHKAVERIGSFILEPSADSRRRFARLERWMPGQSPEEARGCIVLSNCMMTCADRPARAALTKLHLV